MKREYPETRTRFTEEDDILLRYHSERGATCAEIAEFLDRPVGSIYTRRRYLGIGKKRGEYGPRTEEAETPAVELDLWEFRPTETMRKYVMYFYAACLFAAGLMAFFGEV